MAIAFKHTGSRVDLTSTTNNPDAAPEATPRLGGFTLRNRIGAGLMNWLTASTSQVVGASSAIKDAPHTVMNVPPRTLVTGLHLFSVPGETAPEVTATLSPSSCSLSSSDYVFTINFYAQPITKEVVASGVKTTTYASASSVSATLGKILLTGALSAGSLIKNSIKGSAPIIVKAKSSATTTPYLGVLPIIESAASSNGVDAGSFFIPRYFPHGGRINCAVAGTVADVDAEVNKTSLTNAGVWELKATCEYVPE